MRKRWVSLYVENEIGVLAKISGLFSGKNYNIHSLTVGTTEDATVSRMTIGLISDDDTFEQIKKQLNRCVEVIKVLDFTAVSTHMKEVMFVRIDHISPEGKTELFHIAEVFKVKVKDYSKDSMLLECCLTEGRNDDLIQLLKGLFRSIEVVRGGSVAIESISINDR